LAIVVVIVGVMVVSGVVVSDVVVSGDVVSVGLVNVGVRVMFVEMSVEAEVNRNHTVKCYSPHAHQQIRRNSHHFSKEK
jgi:hypothetical protein